MLPENECRKILNDGESKIGLDEIRLLRDFMVSLATIEFEMYQQKEK